MSFGLSLTEVVMSSPCLSALASARHGNYIMTPKFLHCHIESKLFRSGARRSFVSPKSSLHTTEPAVVIHIASIVVSDSVLSEELFKLFFSKEYSFPISFFSQFSAGKLTCLISMGHFPDSIQSPNYS